MSSNSSGHWPDFPEENKFNWSLSLSQIDKKYGSAPLQPPAFKMKVTKRRTVYVAKEADSSNSSELFIKKLAKKFPHAYGLIVGADPDLPRWIYDNLVNSSKK